LGGKRKKYFPSLRIEFGSGLILGVVELSLEPVKRL
jgi:hypothetical protein